MSHWIDVNELPPSREKDILNKIFDECFGMNRKICGECKWHRVIKDYNDNRYEAWACDNEDSPYYTDYTEYTDTCEEFEQRGME